MGDREPGYNGKRLSEWVEIYEHDAEGEARSADTPACRAAVEAVRHMGDKVLPRALKLLRHEKPNWKNGDLRQKYGGRKMFSFSSFRLIFLP